MSIASQAEEPIRATGRGSFLKRVKIRNYKSIASCDVTLKPFTLLVGRNGSGKSNFLDALRFVAEGLVTSVFQAANLRRNSYLFHRANDHPATSFEIELQLDLPSGSRANFGFEVVPIQGRLGVGRESVEIFDWDDNPAAKYTIIQGGVQNLSIHDKAITPSPPAQVGGFYFGQVAGYAEFRELFDALISMKFYKVNPDRMRRFLPLYPTNALDEDGGNVAQVLAYIEAHEPAAKSRLASYLGAMVPEVRDVLTRDLGPVGTVFFNQVIGDRERTIEFTPANMSDGTLRALGILVAINQLADDGSPIRLVGIEEPETGLHPASAGVLMDALREASTATQILATTHSSDLLDRYDPEDDHLLVVRMHEGRTQIGQIDGAGREIIQEHLDTAGGLLRMDHLEPDPSDLKRQEPQPPSSDEGK